MADLIRLEPERRWLRCLHYVLLAASVFIIVVPLLAIFLTAFKTEPEFLSASVYALPKSFTYLDNFMFMLLEGGILRGYWNSLVLCIVSVVISVVLGTMVSYVLDRFQGRATSLIMGAYIVSIMIPFVTTQVAVFGIIRDLGLYNTLYAGILLYAGTDITSIYIFMQFMRRIPIELDESGMMDGASYWRIFRSIIVPSLTPAIATVAILKFLYVYNDMIVPQLYMPGMELKTVSTVLMAFAGERSASWPVVSAGIAIALFPSMLVFLLMQRYIISGVASGAVKG
jgi:multiple sugar transport system permease protein